MNLIYGVKDRPRPGQLVLFALQQLLAILAATITVPMVVNNTPGMAGEMSISAALFGAGAGTLVYQLFTKFRSPVFLGSSFAFINSMCAAFAGGVSMSLGAFGLIIGAVFAGLVYVVIAIAVKFAGVKWIDKLMPAAVIGPTVALIGLSLASSAIQNAVGGISLNELGSYTMNTNSILCLVCALFTFAVTVICSVYGKKMMKMIPFIIGILSGYALAAIFTGFSYIPGAEAMRIIDFSVFTSFEWVPGFTVVELFSDLSFFESTDIGAYIGTIAVAYIPVAFVVFAEHIADHKNISSIIGTDLLRNPGLSRTLLGDGVGSMVGAIFGGCPNTTYGESIGCVAISGNASVVTIFVTALFAIVASFIAPFMAFLESIPGCVMGGVCIALYGFIAVSGLKMVQKVDLNDNGNLFTVSSILIAGVGSLALTFGKITITNIACALILGILTNLLVNINKKKRARAAAANAAQEGAEEPAESIVKETEGEAETSAPSEAAEENLAPPETTGAADGEKADGKREE